MDMQNLQKVSFILPKIEYFENSCNSNILLSSAGFVYFRGNNIEEVIGQQAVLEGMKMVFDCLSKQGVSYSTIAYKADQIVELLNEQVLKDWCTSLGVEATNVSFVRLFPSEESIPLLINAKKEIVQTESMQEPQEEDYVSYMKTHFPSPSDKVKAIAYYRDLMNVGLAEAKQAVEDILKF